MSDYDKRSEFNHVLQEKVSDADTGVKTADTEHNLCGDGRISLVQVKVKNNKLKKWNVVRSYNGKFLCDEITKRLIKIHCDREEQSYER